MAKTKINLNTVRKFLTDANKAANLAASKKVADETVKLMKEKIAQGNSPIANKGKFRAYKNPAKYPGNQKPSRPVNLKLSGKFLDQLKNRVSPVQGKITIGFFSNYGKDLEDGHRNQANGQPSRPIIPEQGERFAKSIQDAIVEIYADAVKKYLRGR